MERTLMLYMNIEIWPRGSMPDRSAIAKMAVWNDGTGDRDHGNYIYMITLEHDPRWGAPGGVITDDEFHNLILPHAKTPPDPDFRDDRIIHHGTIKGYPRRQGSLGLFTAALIDAGFSKWADTETMDMWRL